MNWEINHLLCTEANFKRPELLPEGCFKVLQAVRIIKTKKSEQRNQHHSQHLSENVHKVSKNEQMSDRRKAKPNHFDLFIHRQPPQTHTPTSSYPPPTLPLVCPTTFTQVHWSFQTPSVPLQPHWDIADRISAAQIRERRRCSKVTQHPHRPWK